MNLRSLPPLLLLGCPEPTAPQATDVDDHVPCEAFGTPVDGVCQARLVATPCPDLPQPRQDGASALLDVDGRTWLVHAGGSATLQLDDPIADDLFFAEVTEDGVQPWQSGVLPHAVRGHAMAALGDRLFLLGGAAPPAPGQDPAETYHTSEVLSGRFSPELGALTDVQVHEVMPGSEVRDARAAIVDGMLYVFGGTWFQYRSRVSSRAPVTEDGLGPWDESPVYLSQARTNFGLAVSGSRVWIAGKNEDLTRTYLQTANLAAPSAFTFVDRPFDGHDDPAVLAIGPLVLVMTAPYTSGDQHFDVYPSDETQTWDVELPSIPGRWYDLGVVPERDGTAYLVGGSVVLEDSTRCTTLTLEPR